MTPHQILGVEPDASPADIKRAYRRLAMAWHPDRNDHPDANERFKAISSAYDTLTRPVEMADEAPGENQAEAESAPHAEREAPTAKAADIRIDLELTLEEAAGGINRTMTITRGKPCATCEGTGESGMRRTRMCDPCHGSGRVRGRGHRLEPCSNCSGRGFFSERICPDCGGLGRDEEDIDLVVNVPPGILAGDELRLVGQGEAAHGDLAAGDLYLSVRLLPHPLFRLEGRNLCYDMPVSALSLMAGGEIRVPALGGETALQLDAGLPEERQIVLAAQGYPGRAGGAPGDLVIRLRPVFPARLSAEQKSLLRKADKLFAADGYANLPEIAAWRHSHPQG